MKERRISPRSKCLASLTYKVLTGDEYRDLMEVFHEKRKRNILYDQLSYKNKAVNLKLKNMDNDLASVLADINDQLKLVEQTLSMNYDALHIQEEPEVVINTGGMLFHTRKILPVGSAVEIQLKLVPEIPRLLIIAEILRSEHTIKSEKITTTVAFTYTEPEDKKLLRDFVEQRLS